MNSRDLPSNLVRRLPLEIAGPAADSDDRLIGPRPARPEPQSLPLADSMDLPASGSNPPPTPNPVPPHPSRRMSPAALGAAQQTVIENIVKNLAISYAIAGLDVPVASAVTALHEVDKIWTITARYPELWNPERQEATRKKSEHALGEFEKCIHYLRSSGEVNLLNDSKNALEYFFKLEERATKTNLTPLGSLTFSNCKLSRELLKRVGSGTQPNDAATSSSVLSIKERIVQQQCNMQMLCEALPRPLWSNLASLNTLQRVAWLGVSTKDFKELKIAEALREHGDKQLEGHEVRAFPLQIDALGRDIKRVAAYGSWFALEVDARKIVTQAFKRWTEIPESVGSVVGAAVGMAGTAFAMQNACRQGAIILCDAKGWSISAGALALLSLVPQAALSLAPLKGDHAIAEVLESEGFVSRLGPSGRDLPDLAAMRKRAGSVGYRVADTDPELLSARQGARELDAEAAEGGAALIKSTLAVGASVAAATWAYYTQANACASVALTVACARHSGAASCGTGAIVVCELGSVGVVGAAFAGSLALYGGVRAFIDPSMRDIVTKLMSTGVSAADIAAQIKSTRPSCATMRGLLSAPLVAVGYGFREVGERRISLWQHQGSHIGPAADGYAIRRAPVEE
jgi:hypothetical protein